VTKANFFLKRICHSLKEESNEAFTNLRDFIFDFDPVFGGLWRGGSTNSYGYGCSANGYPYGRSHRNRNT
jgi:hypothetical protein